MALDALLAVALAAAAADVPHPRAPVGAPQNREEWPRCANLGARHAIETRLRACTAIIDSGLEGTRDLAKAYNNRGYAYNDSGDPRRALADLNQALRLNPTYGLAYNNRGNSHALQRHFDRALSDYEMAIRLNPTLAMAYHNRGNIHVRRGDHVRAMSDYDEALRLDLRFHQAYYSRGRLHELLKDRERALADYRRALSLAPDYDRARIRLCQLQSASGGSSAEGAAYCGPPPEDGH